MWPEIVKNLAQYPTMVLNGVDDQGFPFSIRCRPVADPATQTLRIERPAGVPIQTGPASLLGHYHDEQLWNLRMFNVRGRLEEDGDGWRFQPLTIIPGGASSSLSALFETRKRANQYLKKRNLPRPSVPWDDYKALWREVEKKG